MADPRDPYRNYEGSPVTNAAAHPAYSGLNNVGEYMASGMPFSSGVQAPISDSVGSLQFPFVTSELYLKNDGANDVAFGWTENGVVGENRHVLANGESITLKIRTNKIYFTALGGSGDETLNITAALTMIPGRNYPTLTGSLADPVTGMPLHITGVLNPPRGFGYSGLG